MIEWSNNLEKALYIVETIQKLKSVQDSLKRAFKDRELDGGWKAALTHPLYLEAEAKIADLEEQLTLLI